MHGGKIISLEGIHGVGKTTVAPMLVARLRAEGFRIELCTDQTATETGRLVRQVNLKLLNRLDPTTETFLVSAARREAYVQAVQPHLEAGASVITERFLDAFFAFGRVRRTDPHLLDLIAQFVADGRRPDLTILLDCPAHVALARIPQGERHRVEREPMHFHEELREAYLALARADAKRFEVINARKSPEALVEETLPMIRAQLQ